MEPDGGGTITINSLVVGTVHMHYGKLPRQDVLEIIETNFEEGEIFKALEVLHKAVGLNAPQGRQTSLNRTAIAAYAMDMLDIVTKLVSEDKMPLVVVSSDDLSKVPLSKKKMDNTEVTTVNCRLEALEEMMRDVIGKLNKIDDRPSFVDQVPIVTVGNGQGGAVQRAPLAAQGQEQQPVTDRGQQGFQPRGGFGGLGSQAQHASVPATGSRGRSRSPAVKRGYNDVVKSSNENQSADGDFQTVNNRRRNRKMNYGTNKIDEAGAEAAPIEVFVGNTNPRATDEIIKRVLVKCAEKMPESPRLEILEVKLLTNPDRDPNPRFKSWMVRVPYSFKNLMEDDAFYPDGWSHRKYFPKRIQSDRNVRPHLDPNDPVNMELAQVARS